MFLSKYLLMPYPVGILWRQPTPAHAQAHLHAILCAGPSLHLASVSVLHWWRHPITTAYRSRERHALLEHPGILPGQFRRLQRQIHLQGYFLIEREKLTYSQNLILVGWNKVYCDWSIIYQSSWWGDPHHIVKVASNNLPEETFHFSNRKWLERKSKPLLGSDSLHALDSAPGRAASSNKRQSA